MTGYGEARGLVGNAHVSAEIRSVNNRHFKLSLRCPDVWAKYEPELERTLREVVYRGTVSLFLRRDRDSESSGSRMNTDILAGYWQQLLQVASSVGVGEPGSLSHLVNLPGVIESGDATIPDDESTLCELQTLVRQALEGYQKFRRQEGAAMSADLQAQAAVIREQVEQISQFAPQVAAEYRTKLQQRIQEALAASGVPVDRNDLLREVAIFTDRADISEELIRLKSHLEQFEHLMSEASSQGRKLDFLCQELFREANTIGSKANHVGVSHSAVEIKTAIERMREVVQNLE